jgi:uncharacterized protein (TIGR00251 family)
MAGSVLTVRVFPRAYQDEIAGWDGEILRVRLKAPPVDGRANDELTRFLAVALKLPRRDVSILTGSKTRVKRVAVAGLTDEEVAARIALALEGGASTRRRR